MLMFIFMVMVMMVFLTHLGWRFRFTILIFQSQRIQQPASLRSIRFTQSFHQFLSFEYFLVLLQLIILTNISLCVKVQKVFFNGSFHIPCSIFIRPRWLASLLKHFDLLPSFLEKLLLYNLISFFRQILHFLHLFILVQMWMAYSILTPILNLLSNCQKLADVLQVGLLCQEFLFHHEDFLSFFVDFLSM